MIYFLNYAKLYQRGQASRRLEKGCAVACGLSRHPLRFGACEVPREVNVPIVKNRYGRYSELAHKPLGLMLDLGLVFAKEREGREVGRDHSYKESVSGYFIHSENYNTQV